MAVITGHRLRPLVDESAFLGLGATVDAHAHLGAAARAELVETLTRYATTARQLGATSITFMGTEPIRRAADGASIVAEVEASSGVPLHVLTHEEEAYLTLIGVTHGRPVTHETLVVDIGGGSSEFCAVGPRDPARAAGLRIGSNRLTARFATDDPPTDDDIAAMLVTADEIMRDALDVRPTEIVIVGGTASNLLKVTDAGVTDAVITARPDRRGTGEPDVPAGPGQLRTLRRQPDPGAILPAGAGDRRRADAPLRRGPRAGVRGG